MSGFLKGHCVSDLLNNLCIPVHRMLLWDGERLFFPPLEWHKNKCQLMLYTHIWAVGDFFLWENITLSILTIKYHYTYFLYLLKFLVFN